MPDFELSGELSLKIELHMLRPITEKVHSGNGPVSLVPIPCNHTVDFGKGCRMGRSDKVSLWYVLLLINTRFHIFILE